MDAIRRLRKQKRLTMKELGSRIGCSESAISQYETGKRSPDYETLLKIAEELETSVNYLLTGEPDSSIPSNIIPIPKMHSVPLVGTIACGEPILASENIEGEVSMPEHVHADFALRCKGDSMINARIYDGDIVYIREQPTVEDGQIAAVLIDEEATLKRVHLFPDHIVLEPENPLYRPFAFWGEEMNSVRILGKAVAFTSAVR